MEPQKKSFNPIFDIYSNFMPEYTNFKLKTDLGLKLKNIEKQKNKININKEKRIKKFSFTFKNKEDKLNVNENKTNINENNNERIIQQNMNNDKNENIIKEKKNINELIIENNINEIKINDIELLQKDKKNIENDIKENKTNIENENDNKPEESKNNIKLLEEKNENNIKLLEENNKINITTENEKEENKINNIRIEEIHIDKIEEKENNIETLKTEIIEEEELKKEEEIKEEIKYISHDLSVNPLLIGLKNIGNSCYMNTSIQILLHCQKFINKLNNDKNKPITNSLYNLFQLLLNDENNKINPNLFKKEFEKKHLDYKGNNQHDSIEFTRILLDDLSNENNISHNDNNYEELITKNKSIFELDKEYYLFYKKREDSFIIDLFYNQIINKFKCKCKYEKYSFEKIIDIPLIISKLLMSFTLENLLDFYFKDEELKWENECEKCGKKTVHKKITKISHLSQILIISFQRINQITGKKDNTFIEFPHNLNMKNYCEKGIANTYFYELFAIINHSGSITSGHYYAVIKLNNEWYEFNDSKVVKITLRKEKMISNLVYCLYYIKKY